MTYQQKTLKPNRSEPLRFKGRIVAETEWTTRAGEWMRFAVWETKGGALIPTIEGSVPGSDERDMTATVIEPIYKRFDQTRWLAEVNEALKVGLEPGASITRPEPSVEVDLKAMHIAVLRFYDGHHRARQMMRAAGFDFIREVA